MDVISQAKSGMGKTAVFVLATLQQIEPVDGQVNLILDLKYLFNKFLNPKRSLFWSCVTQENLLFK